MFLIRVNCKLNLENSFENFANYPEIDMGHKHVLAAEFYSLEIISLPTAVTPEFPRSLRLGRSF